MKDFEKYYDFIKDDETKNTVKKIADKALQVSKNYITCVTEFTNPYVAELCSPIIRNFDVKFELFPSSEHCERKVFILYPDYLEEINEDDYITTIRIRNKSKFKKLNHKDYLGSIMSLGIDRNKTGDIFVYEDFADVVVNSDIADYINYNMDMIGHNKIETEKIKLENTLFKEQEHVILNITSSSMRLDSIVKHLANKSREEAASMVRGGAVKVNFRKEDKISQEVKDGDMISISKFGRFKISKLSGVTKSGKYKIEVKHYV